MALPAHGDAHGIETGGLHSLDELLGHHGVAPCRLGVDGSIGIAYGHRLSVLAGSRTFKLVAQIPACHVLVPLLCGDGLVVVDRCRRVSRSVVSGAGTKRQYGGYKMYGYELHVSKG